MLLVICLLLLIGQSGTQYTYPKGGSDQGHGTAGEASALSCPGLWSTFDNATGRCICGFSLGGVIFCDESTLEVRLIPCYCMSFYEKDPNITVIGACMYMCHHIVGGLVFKNASDLSENMCGKGAFVSNREGQLCGRCKQGFAPPAYSYDWRCVQCSSSFKNVTKYCVIVFLPLTIFFVLVITFRISATSPSMNAFLLVCQVLTSPPQVRIVSSGMHIHVVAVVTAVLESLYGFWNLDFFRTLYPPFCLHPSMSTLQVLALDYVVAVYPLLLTVLTYLLIELHNRNCKLVVWLWKPLHWCCARLRGQCDIQTSLIEAFASFLLLSYVKFLSVSFDFLVPVNLYNAHGESLEPYLYFDGTVEYFGKQHLPYAILAIVVLSIFNILPLLLLCLYPCHCFQRILNACKLRCQALHIFMDAFQGCYKNGTNGTRDCRYFSALYLLVRISIFMVIAVSLSSSIFIYCYLVGVIFTLFAILFAVAQPHKLPIHNAINTMLILIVVIIYFSIPAIKIVRLRGQHSGFNPLMYAMFYVFVPVPFIYIIVLLLYRHFFGRKKMTVLMHKVRLLCKSALRKSNLEESLPYRLANPEECAALLQDPMAVYQYSDNN